MTPQFVQETLKRLRIEVSGTSNSGYYQAKCPFAPFLHKQGLDNHPSFGVRSDGSHYYCFSCGQSGNLAGLISSLQEVSGRDLSVISEFVHKSRDEEPFLRHRVETGENRVTTFHEDYLSQFEEIETKNVIKYLTSRQIDQPIAELFGLRYDIRRNMVVFPIRTIDGLLAGSFGRYCGARRKHHFYWAPDGFKKSLVLGGHQFMRDCARLFVFEGFQDMLPHWKSIQELDGTAVCTFGCNPSSVQLSYLLWSDYTIYNCYDRDKPGEDGHKKMLNSLGNMAGRVKRFSPPPGVSDFGKMRRDRFVSFFNRTFLEH